MQRRALWSASASLLSATVILTAGCNDLGTCDDPARGRTTVRVGGQVMYAGQAIMTRSCATGCHSSQASGAGRVGAPAGLDFNLLPLSPGALVRTDAGITGVEVDAAEASGLRARQRKVYDERELIWEQVDKGLMPPKGVGDAFKTFANFVGITFESDGKCTAGKAIPTLDDAKGELRNWLACGTPIVETVSPELPFRAPAADAGEPELASGAASYTGPAAVGYQLPACVADVPDGGAGDGGVGDGGGGATFAEVFAIFEDLNNACTLCHAGPSAMGDFDIGTIEVAYTTLLGPDGMGGATTCANDQTPYVTPMDPESSYLLNMVDADLGGRCTPNVMPLGQSGGLDDASLQTIRSWIMAGAPR